MRNFVRAIAPFLAAGLLLLLPITLLQADNTTLDVQEELALPGTKLVVIDFYASWCIPCMDAVPRWKALHEKYKRMGLRFIAISADEGVCTKAEWMPDKKLCDTNGILQSQFNIGTLPTSLVYSWDGNLAIRTHDVGVIETAVKEYFENTQFRIEVDDVDVRGDDYAIGSNPVWVRDEVISKVRQHSKFDIVEPSGRTREIAQTDVCSPALSANSYLHIRLFGDDNGERFLSLQLEKDGCIKASAQEPYSGQGRREDKASLRKAIARAVATLLAQVIKPGAPKDVSGNVQVSTFENRFDDDGSSIQNPIVDETGYLAVQSEPSGGTIYINGEEKGRTPNQFELPLGEYVVIVKKGALWIPARQRIQLGNQGAALSMRLGAKFGILEVNSSPPGADIAINGEPTGFQTPHTFTPKVAGKYTLTLSRPLYFSRTVEVQLGNGKTEKVDETLKPNFGSLFVTSEPSGADILVDGVYTGEKTPAIIKPLSTGLHDVMIRLEKHSIYKKKVNIICGKTARLKMGLTAQTGLLKVEVWTRGRNGQEAIIGAKVFLNGNFVGNAPYKEELLIGEYHIEVRADGYRTGRKDVVLEEGETEKVSLVLEKQDVSGVPQLAIPQTNLDGKVGPPKRKSSREKPSKPVKFKGGRSAPPLTLKSGAFIVGVDSFYSYGRMKVVKAYEEYEYQDRGNYSLIGSTVFLGGRIGSFFDMKIGGGGGGNTGSSDASFGLIYLEAEFSFSLNQRKNAGIVLSYGYNYMIYSFEDEKYVGIPFVFVIPNHVKLGAFYRPTNFVELGLSLGALWYDPLNGTTEEEAEDDPELEADDGFPVNAVEYIGLTVVFGVKFVI